MEVLHAKVEETYRHLETGEIFKTRKDWDGTGRESYHAKS
jgi:hypothetical protein